MKIKPSDVARMVAAKEAASVTVVEPEAETLEAVTEAEDAPEMYRTFTNQDIALIGSPTSDGRILAANIELSFRSFPLPLMWCKQSAGAHDMAYTVGVIEDAYVSGNTIKASGYFMNSPEADEATTQISHGVSNPSVDLADADYVYTDKNGRELDEDQLWDTIMSGGDYFVTFTKAELIGTTLVSTPAFDTKIHLDTARGSREVAIVAAAGESFRPPVYDHTLFESPGLTGPTAMTISEDGRIFGHIAVFNECHRSVQTGPGQCQLVPRSPSNYDQFHTSPPLAMDDGGRLAVGRLTVGIGHADTRWNAGPAMAHYDNADNCWALGRAGEDKHGVWFSGIAAPWATTEMITQGLSSPLSGDWRDFGMGLDMIAALSVNTPGFAVKGRTDHEGRDVSLVASMAPSTHKRGGVNHLSAQDIADAVSKGVVEGLERSRQAELHAKKVAAAMERARGFIKGDAAETAAKPGPSQAGSGQPSGGGSYPGKISADKTTAHPKLAEALDRAAKLVV